MSVRLTLKKNQISHFVVIEFHYKYVSFHSTFLYFRLFNLFGSFLIMDENKDKLTETLNSPTPAQEKPKNWLKVTIRWGSLLIAVLVLSYSIIESFKNNQLHQSDIQNLQTVVRILFKLANLGISPLATGGAGIDDISTDKINKELEVILNHINGDQN